MRTVSSESVTAGHPDKIADQISDAILDACLAEDKNSRVACETLVTTGTVVVAGEITTKTYVDIPKIVRNKILDIGYDDAALGIDGESCGVLVSLDAQSPDIAMGVDRGSAPNGAGDQGMMFGYATNETSSYLPLPLEAAHFLTKGLHRHRDMGVDFLRPDGKAQVTVTYPEEGNPYVSAIVVSTQHSPYVSQASIEIWVREVLLDEFPFPIYEDAKFYVNPTGKFVRGGPHADCGLTGRKIIVDTYGGVGRHGGGAFSGKDPSKVDRSGAYAARQLAKAVVSGGFADKCEVQLAYAIGVAQPVSIYVDFLGTSKGFAEEHELAARVIDKVDLTPDGMVDRLDLLNFSRYQDTAVYGHFTDQYYPWEEKEGVSRVLNSIV